MNPNFHTKIASVEGGLEIMLCAGFELQQDETNEVKPGMESSENDLDTGTVYLKHRGIDDLGSEAKLHYTLFK
jgi:hypothetical protein